MEFQLASEGKVEALRRWLRAHPGRVDEPSAAAGCTLLATAIAGGGRAELAELGRGEDRRAAVIRLLCEEFGADPGTPSGALADTPVHLCVRIAAEGALRYLVGVRAAPLRGNALGETPLDLAERATTAAGQRCAAFLREEIRRRERAAAPAVPFPSPSTLPPPSCAFADVGTALPSKTPYPHQDLTHLERLPDSDLQAFRAAYKNGFSYSQCRHHYEIRGPLPYRFENVVYYTPVILIVDHALESPSPLSSSSQSKRYRALIDMQNIGIYAISRKALYIDPLSGAIIPSAQDHLACHNLLDFVRVVMIQNFERVPPMVGPSSPYGFPFSTEVGLIGSASDHLRHHHSRSSPGYFRDVLEKRTPQWLLIYRVLQDFSRFGDDLFKYESAHHNATGHIPIFRELKKGGGVFSSSFPRPASARDHLYNAYPYLGVTPCSPHSTGRSPGERSSTSITTTTMNTSPLDAIDTQLMLMIPVKITFFDPYEANSSSQYGSEDAGPFSSFSNGGYLAQPRVYLLDVAEDVQPVHQEPFASLPNFTTSPSSSSSTAALNYACFKALVQDRRTGLVRPEIIASVCRPSSGGGDSNGPFSLYDLLIFLQARLSEAVEAFLSDPDNLPVCSPKASQGDSWWEDLFGPNESPPPAPSNCLLCGVNVATVGLLPCRHRPLCGGCAGAYKNHCRGGVGALKYAESNSKPTAQAPPRESALQLDFFLCPVCHERALGTEEVAE